MHAQRCDVGQDRSLITRRDNICFSEDDYGLGGGVGRGLGVGANLGVGVGLGVDVAVAVAVGVGVGVAVGDGVPTAAAISMRPQPYTLFGGPAAPHCVEEINTAELFKASRLAVI